MLDNWVDKSKEGSNGFTNKVNGYGVLFRFITPILTFLMTIIGTLALTALNDIKHDMDKACLDRKEIKVYFDNHLKHHTSFEVSIEKRLSKIETILERQ